MTSCPEWIEKYPEPDMAFALMSKYTELTAARDGCYAFQRRPGAARRAAKLKKKLREAYSELQALIQSEPWPVMVWYGRPEDSNHKRDWLANLDRDNPASFSRAESFAQGHDLERVQFVLLGVFDKLQNIEGYNRRPAGPPRKTFQVEAVLHLRTTGNRLGISTPEVERVIDKLFAEVGVERPNNRTIERTT